MVSRVGFQPSYTEWAERKVIAPEIDRNQYPAHLQSGILAEWRRLGIGTALMMQFADYLKKNGNPGFHLYASSYHALGVAFYQKLGLELPGQFDWRLHNGFDWMNAIEKLFGMRIMRIEWYTDVASYKPM